MSIIFKLGLEYLVFVSAFHSSKLTARNWRMPSLANFMESLTQEPDKLVQMGAIKSTKAQAHSVGVSNQSKGKKKAKYLKQQEKKKQEKPKSSDGVSNPSKDREKKKKGKKKITYCHKYWHP